MHDADDATYDDAPQRKSTVEVCDKCHASGPDGPKITSAGPGGVTTVFHTEECMDDYFRAIDARKEQTNQHDALVRRGLAALRSHLYAEGTPSGATAPHAAALTELVDLYLVHSMRGRFVVHDDLFDIVGRHFAHVPGIDGGTPKPDATGPDELEAFAVPDDDAALLAWVLDHGGTIAYDGDLQHRPKPLHRITLPDGESIVVAPGERLLGGHGTIHLAVPDH